MRFRDPDTGPLLDWLSDGEVPSWVAQFMEECP